MNNSLINSDLALVVRRIPKDVRDLLSKYHGTLFLGGGFIRAVVAGETPSDIDLFGVSPELLKKIAEELQATRGGKEKCLLHHTKNAITVISVGRTTVQFITRWCFSEPEQVCDSFDFTICQAVIYRQGGAKKDGWGSVIGQRFYIDLAARRIFYTFPVRDEDAGGSLMRALKYVKRGYSIQIDSLSGVVSRLTRAVDFNKVRADDEAAVSFVMRGLLQEVDPSIAVDGLEVVDDHEASDASFGLPETVQ